MILSKVQCRNQKVLEMRWNGVPVFIAKTADIPTVYWGWDELSEDYPNTADNTELFDFTRHLINYSSSKPTREWVGYQDLDEPGTNVYHVSNGSYDRPALMYFSFTLPAHTSIEIEGKFQGYSYNYSGSYGTYAVYATSTKPTSTTNYASTAEAVLYNGANKSGYAVGEGYSKVHSSEFNTYTAILTNDTDDDKTYYMVLQVDIDYNSNNYRYGLYVKYLKFTKI